MARTTDRAYSLRVGVALQAIQDYLDITQEDMAAAGKTTVSTISRYQNGHATRASVLVELAHGLALPVELLTDPPDGRDAVMRRHAHLDGEQRADAETS